MEGWIKYHRKIIDHFLFKEDRIFSKFEAWTYLLLSANHKECKIVLGNEIIELNAGEFITSQLKLMELFKWSKSKLRGFLSLLEKENMILIKSDRKKTTISIINYGNYQSLETTKRPLIDHNETINRLQKDTDKNVKNEKKENREFNFRQSLINLGVEKCIVDDWMKVRKSKKATNTETSFTRIKNQIEKSGFSANRCITLAVEKDWKGFEASWIGNYINNDKDPLVEHVRKMTGI